MSNPREGAKRGSARPGAGWRVASSAVILLVLAGLAWSCAPKEDWRDPAWIAHRMSVGDDRAFVEFSRLEESQKLELVPNLIEAYNDGIRREQALAALIESRDQRGREVFLSALQRPGDREAGLGARGLAVIEDTSSATAIAQRLTQVSTPDGYGPFMEALIRIPTPQAAEVVSGVLMRPAGRIGGINTVRNGCRMLGELDELSDEMVSALVYSLVNFIPQPYEDAMSECELALLRHGDRPVSALAEVLRGENARIGEHLTNLGYPPVTGQLRAARVLSRRATPATIEVFNQYFNTDTPIPRAEMLDMPIEVQQDWYSTFGQLFDISVKTYALRGNDEDRQMLRSLERPGDGQALNNFSQWMNLSDGAEVGMRQAAQEALAWVNHPEDRAMLIERARTGTTGRGGARTNVMMRINLAHYVGRTARGDEMATFDRIVAAQPEAYRSQFEPLRAYFIVAASCETDWACYGNVIDNPGTIAENEAFASLLEGFESDEERQAMQRGIQSAARQAAIWQLAIVHREDTAAVNTLVERIGMPDMGVRLQITSALMTIRQLPEGTAARLDSILEEEASVRGVPNLREVRHNFRLLRLLHT